MIGGLFGVMQLPGRLLMTRSSFMPSPLALLVASFGLQVGGLAALMAEGSQAAMWTGVTVFACGAGLTIQHVTGPRGYGVALDNATDITLDNITTREITDSGIFLGAERPGASVPSRPRHPRAVQHVHRHTAARR